MEKMNCWRLAPNQNLSGSQDHLEGMAQLHLHLSPVHKSCPTPTLKVLPHNHLPVSSLASRERRSAYCRRTFQVFAFNAHARLTTYLKRGCVWPDFLEWKNRRIFLFMVGTDNPLYQNVQVYCCLSSAFSADVTYKKITSPVLSILCCGI